MADLKISELPVLSGQLLQATDPFAVADLSASETKQLNAEQLAAGIAGMFPSGSIPSSAVDVVIADGSITTAKLADAAVTAIKLADNSSATVSSALPTAGSFVGQFAIETTGATASVWNGSSWLSFKAAGSVNSISGGTGRVQITPSDSSGNVTLNTSFEVTTSAREFVAGPTGAGGTVDYRQIVGLDLPTANATEQGAVQVGGDGLTMSTGRIIIDNDVTASGVGAYHVVAYDAKGLITDGRAIDSTDLPIATAGSPGIVMPGADMTVTAGGQLNMVQNIPGGGEFTKVTVNGSGIVTAGTVIGPDDVPNLPAEKITSGFLNPQRTADHSIERSKLADYSISFIQEAAPSTGDASLYAGCLWFQESTAQLRMWNQNAWTSVGFGRLAADNLRFGGLINASTGDVTGLTNAGITAGLVIGNPLPVATDGLGGLYLVVDTAGSNIGVTPAVAYDPGDWCLCVSEAEGWVRIDTLSGGGGGGGVDLLSQLLDVSISNPSEGDLLVYGSNALWDNVSTLDGGVY